MKTQLEQFIDKIKQRIDLIDSNTKDGKYATDILHSITKMGELFLERERRANLN